MKKSPLIDLLLDENFTKSMKNAIVAMFNNQPTFFVETPTVKAKTINIQENDNLLVVMRDNKIEVYREESYSDDIFSYAKKSLLNNDEIYSSQILILNEGNDDSLAGRFNKLSKMLESLVETIGGEKIEKLKGSLKMMSQGDLTYSPYELSWFQKYLVEKGFLENILVGNKDLMDLSTKSYNHESLKDRLLTIDFLINVLTEKNINKDNALVFNDGDNSIYMKDGNLVFSCQNTCTIVVKNKDEYTFYGLAYDNNNHKKYSSFEDLEKSIGSDDTYLDNIVFKAKDNNVIFSDSTFAYVLEINLEFFKNWVEEEFDVVAKYPVDIYSYDYQVKYHQKMYGYTEFEFITHCLLTLGNGITQENGNFYNPKVKYIKGIEDIEINERPESFKNMGYCYLLKTNMALNDDWKKAAQYMVDVLKNDRPKTEIFEGDNYDEALNKIIDYWQSKVDSKKKNKL